MKTTKTKKPKARVMWALCNDGVPESLWSDRKTAGFLEDPKDVVKGVWIPLDDVPALVEQVAKSMALRSGYTSHDWRGFSQEMREIYRNDARAALIAAGIPCKQRRARK